METKTNTTLSDIKAAIMKRKALTLLTQEDCDVLEEIIRRFTDQQTKQLQEENAKLNQVIKEWEMYSKAVIEDTGERVELIDSLQKENAKLKEALTKVYNIIGNCMHDDNYEIGQAMLDIQEIVVKS